MATNKFSINLYNPAQKDREALKQEFVVRTKIFNTIFEDIKNAKMSHSEQAFLLVGQRGSGKSTLLQRLRYAIEDDTTLNRYLIPIVFTEEQYNINELTNIWETIAEVLEDYHGFEGLTKKVFDAISTKQEYEEAVFNILTSELKAHGRKIVVLIDNIGDIFKKLDDLEVKRLREVLQTTPELRLVAANTTLSDHMFDYREPFHEFFNVITLDSLKPDEVKNLLEKLAEKNDPDGIIKKVIEKEPQRIEVLRQLTGGVPRTIAMMFNVFMDNVDGKSVQDLQLMLDTVTPLYKARLDDLSKQQQKIVDAVAKHWDAITVKELAERTRLDSKLISAQLNQLVKDNFIEVVEKGKRTKNNLYRVRERFLNIWYLMRYGRKHDQSRVLWLVKFMESILDKDHLHRKVENHISQIQTGNYDREASLLMSEALLACVKIDTEIKWNLFKTVKKNLPHYGENIKLNNNEYMPYVGKLIEEEKYLDSIQILTELEPNYHVLSTLGFCYYFMGQYENAEAKLIAAKDIEVEDVKGKSMILQLLAEINRLQRNFDISLQYIEESLKISHDAYNYYLSTSINLQMGNFSKASENYKIYVDMGGDDLDLRETMKSIMEFVRASLKHLPNKIKTDLFLSIMSGHINPNDEEAKNVELRTIYFYTLIGNIVSKRDKHKAYDFYRILKDDYNENLGFNESLILIWNGYYAEAIDAFHSTMKTDGEDERNELVDELIDFFEVLVAKNYIETAYNLFNTYSFLKDIIKPIWYSLLKLMGEEKEMEFLTMPPELNEAVQKTIKQIEQAKIDYA